MSTHLTATLVGIIVLVSTAFSQSGATPAASPGASDLDPGAPVYLALGDSLAVGVGASDPEQTGYVPLLYDMLRASLPDGSDLQLVNVAEKGGTTSTLVENQLPTALSLVERRNGDDDPANDVEVITIDIGGNDAFKPLGDICATGLSDACMQAVQDVFTTLSENLRVTLGQLRAAAPGATIVIMTYFNSLVACDRNASAPAAELVLEGAPDGSLPGMNDIIREIAAGTNVLVAEAHGEVGAADLVGGEDCLHPNDDGHQKIADAFASMITTTGPATPVAGLASAARW